MIEQFGPHMIERCLRSEELRFMTDQAGNHVLDFSADDRSFPDFRAHVCAEGPDHNVLFIQIAPRDYYPASARVRLEAAAQGWNCSTRWAKAYVAESPRGVRVVSESGYPLSAGVHQPLVDDLIMSNLFAAKQLFVSVRDAAGESTIEELESWLGKAG
jgi:hypothetical protein